MLSNFFLSAAVSPQEICNTGIKEETGVEKVGCCQYNYADWGLCQGGKKYRTILSLKFGASGVRCFHSKVSTTANTPVLGSASHWKGITWDTCEGILFLK